MTNNNSRDELCNIDKYDPPIIAERIKNAAYSKNITIKEVLTANLSADYVRGILHLPPTRSSSSTNNDI